MSINRVCLSGNLTREPELRRTASGTDVLTFGIAVNERRKNQSTGEWEDYANFFDCTMFGKRASAVEQYLSKGSKVAVEGRLRYSSWERDGQKRSKVEVMVDELEFMSARQGAQDGWQVTPTQNYAPQYQTRPQAAPQQQQGAYAPQPNAAIYDDDIPF